MMRHANQSSSNRRATVTVIVVAFLALFAVLGITFLLASQRFATTTRLNREMMTRERDTPPQPDILMQRVMNDILYDSTDNGEDVYKATRGWSLSRLVYGQHPVGHPSIPYVNDTTPYSGIGRSRTNNLPPTVVTSLGLSGVTSDYYMLNYRYFPKNADGTTDGFVRDPERAGPQGGFRPVADPTQPITYTNAPPGANDYYWPINANYTSADENNPYLAVIDPNSGRVILPSFHRPQAFAFGWSGWNQTTDPWAMSTSNPNWNNKLGKYLLFRPRNAEHSPNFPKPKLSLDGSNTWGDVENLEGKPGGVQYDSVWLDLNLPVSYWKGKRYKPLVAMLITDLDNRINLNTAGNLRNGNFTNGYSHGSNQNLGPWEVNPSNLLTAPGDLNRLLNGNAATSGRYGGATATNTTIPASRNIYPSIGPSRKKYPLYADEVRDNNPVGGYLPHFYAPVDMDGGAPNTSANRWRNPGSGSNTAPYEAFPVFGTQTPAMAESPFSAMAPYSTGNRYWNGRTDNEAVGQTIYSERLNHPMLYNPYLNQFLALGATTGPTNLEPKTFLPSEVLALNARFQPMLNAIHPITGGSTLNSNANLLRSDAAKLTSLGLNTSAANRFRVTTISNDFNRPGGTPWVYNDPVTPFVKATSNTTYPYITGLQQHKTDATIFDGDYDGNRRSLFTILGAVDLNRPLTDYRTNTNQPYSQTNIVSGTTLTQAVTDRQTLAHDIFVRLRAAMGVNEPSTLAAGSPEYLVAQKLAQLAVNIVDYMDHDDYSTPFHWTANTTSFPASYTAPAAPADMNGNIIAANANSNWVFGHELPRLVINEVMARLENDPNEPDITNPPAMGDRQAKRPYKMRVWAELHNTLTPRDANEIGQLADGGQAKLVNSAGQPIYRLRVAKNNANTINALMNPANIGGDVPAAELHVPNPAVLDTAPAQTVTEVYPNVISSVTMPAQTGYADADITKPEFYIVGPSGDASMGALPKLPDATATTANGQFTNLEYDVNSPGGGSPGLEPNTVITNAEWSPVLVLQRLLNEHLPPSDLNPYVTIDSFMPGNYNNPGSNVIDTAATITPVSIVQDRVQITPTVDRIKADSVPKWNTIFAYGKRQPYLSSIHMPTPSTDTRYRQQPEETTSAMDEDKRIRHTFHRHNGKKTDGSVDMANDTIDRPFVAMPHLDRRVHSVAELMNVSIFSTHMVTHLFYTPTMGGTRMMYQADWLNAQTGLSRAFDLLGTPGRFHGQGFAGRTPGKVNINTLNDREVFRSVVDYSNLSGAGSGTSGKNFTTTDADNVWNRLQQVRQTSPLTNFYSGSTQPILGTLSPNVAAGDLQYPTGMDSTKTLPGIVRDAGLNNVAQQEMLNTLIPNTTTRSNTFAIYATIGFFEVLNEGTGVDKLTYPNANNEMPIMGSEIIGVDGKPVRFKFFSVVDRTQLTYFQPASDRMQGIGTVNFSYQPVGYSIPPNTAANTLVNTTSPDPQPTNSQSLYVAVSIPRNSFSGGAANGSYDGVNYSVRIGSQFVIDYNPDVGGGIGNMPGNQFMPAISSGNGRNKMEVVNVSNVVDDPANNRSIVVFAMTRPHARGATMYLMNPDTALPFSMMPGNPGVQSNTFNLGANTYKSVIPVFERIDGY